MLSLTVAAAIVLSAPPPKADKTGRITFWHGDKVEQFNPDGGDRTTMPAPDVKGRVGDVICFTPRQKLAAYTESPSQNKGAKFDHKLVVNPLDENGKRYPSADASVGPNADPCPDSVPPPPGTGSFPNVLTIPLNCCRGRLKWSVLPFREYQVWSAGGAVS
jgi:hypothetical protein